MLPVLKFIFFLITKATYNYRKFDTQNVVLNFKTEFDKLA